jgi:hypothetical protein
MTRRYTAARLLLLLVFISTCVFSRHASAQPTCNPSVAPNAVACQAQAVSPQPTDIVLGQQATGPSRANQTVKISLSQLMSGSGSIMTGSTNGIGRPDSVSTVVAGSGIFSVTDTIQAARTSNITFAAGDMGTLIPANSGVSTVTISATNFGTTVFGAGMTSCIDNNTTGAIAITNSSGASMFPAFSTIQIGETFCLTGDGTNMYAMLGVSPIISVARGGTGISALTTGAIPRGAGASPLVVSNLSDSGVLVSSAVATTGGQTPLTDGGTIAVDGQHDTYTLTITGNHTMLNPSTLNIGQNITFVITQDGTGGRVITWSIDYNWMSGAPPLLNPAPGAVTVISCKVNSSSTLYCAGGAPVPAYQAYSCPITFTTGTGAGTLSCMMKVPRAFTVDNIIATVSGTFSSVTLTFYECGTSTTCASSPTTIGSQAVTSANTATPITVASSVINSGDYVGVEITASSATSGTLTLLAEMH